MRGTLLALLFLMVTPASATTVLRVEISTNEEFVVSVHKGHAQAAHIKNGKEIRRRPVPARWVSELQESFIELSWAKATGAKECRVFAKITLPEISEGTRICAEDRYRRALAWPLLNRLFLATQ